TLRSFFSLSRRPPRPTPFPYTTLFRSHAVLEGAVHALAVERHHRVRGVADQHRLAADVPAVQVERAQAAHRVGLEVVPELRDQRSEEHTSELQSREKLVCRLLPEKKKI